MLQITDLPLEITDMILRIATEHNRIHDSWNWKKAITLLAVNTTWRSIATTRIYKHAYLYNNRSLNGKKIELSTNINLITATNHTHLVRYLVLFLDNYMCVGNFLGLYQSMFEFDKRDWSNVRNIRVSINGNSTIVGGSAFNNPHNELVPKMALFADQLVHHTPNVFNLTIVTYICSNMTRTLNNRLVYGYNCKLRSITSSSFVSFNTLNIFNNLTALDIRIDPSCEILVPKVNIAALKRLRLNNVPPHFTWNMLDATRNSKLLEFSSLETLELIFLANLDVNNNNSDNYGHALNVYLVSADDSKMTRIIFPKLHFVNINGDSNLLFLNQSCHFPKHIHSITILYSINALYFLRKCRVQSFDDIFLYFRLIKPEEQQLYYQTTNYFLNGNNSAKNSRLTVYERDIIIDWKQTTWDKLDSLALFDCEFTNIPLVLTKLPNLKILSITTLLLNNLPNHIDNLMSSVELSQLNVPPINSKIEELNVAVLDGNSTHHLAFVPHIKHFLLQATCIKTLDIYNNTWMKLAKFVKDYESRFPHLSNVDIGYGYDAVNAIIDQPYIKGLFCLMGSNE